MGAFSGDVTTNLVRQCRALKIEKLKAPLFRGPDRAGATNDWCIRKRSGEVRSSSVASLKNRVLGLMNVYKMQHSLSCVNENFEKGVQIIS